jgi:hypothetical protein
MEPDPRHQCLIYGGAPSNKLPVLAAIIKRRLNDGYRCLYLNSAPMVAGMRSILASYGVDVTSEQANARLIMSSETVCPNGYFDSDAMLEKLEHSVDQATQDGFKGLWASGDMTWEFGSLKNFSALLEYEMGLERLFKKKPALCGVCQYHMDSMPREALQQSLLVHPGIVVSDTLTRLNPHYLQHSWPCDSQTRRSLDDMLDVLRAS